MCGEHKDGGQGLGGRGGLITRERGHGCWGLGVAYAGTHVNVCAKLGFWLLWMGWVYVGVVSWQVVGQAGEYPCECLCKTCVLGAVDFPVDFLVDFSS